MKWEAVLAMVALVVLGVWLVYQPRQTSADLETRDGSQLAPYRIGTAKGWVEFVSTDAGERTFRMLSSTGEASAVLSEPEFRAVVGDTVADQVVTNSGNPYFRLFNISSYASMVWIAIGLSGQAVFSCRFLIQWIVSERRKESVIPEIFWWISLVGGVSLFTYFVWRQDIVGVLGQSTGVVIYARNIRLIRKQKRRQAKRLAQHAEASLPSASAPRPKQR